MRRDIRRQLDILDLHMTAYCWMIEEQRVSLFAQEQKTRLPVLVKRLKKQFAKVQ